MADLDSMDANFLGAIGEFLQEFEFLEDAQQTILVESEIKVFPKSNSSLANGSKKTDDRRSRWRYRKKLIDERDKLKRQVYELSTTVAKLQQAEKYALEQEKKAQTLALIVWRSIALRQREKRQEAEELQRQLKATALQNQTEMIRQMNSLLTQLQTSEPTNSLHS